MLSREDIRVQGEGWGGGQKLPVVHGGAESRWTCAQYKWEVRLPLGGGCVACVAHTKSASQLHACVSLLAS